jgi:hypothetical protein
MVTHLLAIDWTTVYKALVCLAQNGVERLGHLYVEDKVANREAYGSFHSL